MATTPRRRRGRQSPTSMIVNFFLDHPLEAAVAALELAQTLIARRQADAANQLVPAATTRRSAPRLVAPGPFTPPATTAVGQATTVAQTSPSLAREAAPAAMPAPVRQRAKRSDAGKPRKQAGAVANAETAAPATEAPTKRRGRPPVTGMPVATAPAAMPAIPELPPQDVPYEARETDPTELA